MCAVGSFDGVVTQSSHHRSVSKAMRDGSGAHIKTEWAMRGQGLSGETRQTCLLYRMAPDDFVAGDRVVATSGGMDVVAVRGSARITHRTAVERPAVDRRS